MGRHVPDEEPQDIDPLDVADDGHQPRHDPPSDLECWQPVAGRNLGQDELGGNEELWMRHSSVHAPSTGGVGQGETNDGVSDSKKRVHVVDCSDQERVRKARKDAASGGRTGTYARSRRG